MQKLSLLVAVVVSACGSIEEVDEEQEEVLADDTIVYDTIVTLGPDGAVTSEPRAITVGEQRAQLAARERGEKIASADPYDPGCGTSSLWLYYRRDWTGARICFRGCGTAGLWEYLRFSNIGGIAQTMGTWEMYEGSHWAGADVGFLGGWSGSGPTIKTTSWGYYSGKQAFSHHLKSRVIAIGYNEPGVGCP